MDVVAILMVLLPAIVLLGYPAALLCAGALAQAPPRLTGPVPETVSILIRADDDVGHVAVKLETVIAAVAAWPGHAEILVGDTSADDMTAAIDRFAHRGVTFVRDGTLARLAPMARGEILVMTDAEALFEDDTLSALLAPFADPRIGAVAGDIETIRDRGSRLADADTLRRRGHRAMRIAEDRLFGCVVADGALYAIRCTLMPRVPAGVADDVFVGTAAVAAGRRIGFARGALAWAHGGGPAFRAQGTARTLTALWCRRELMNPVRTGWYGIALLRELLRPMAALALPPLWVVSGLLGAQPFWAFIFALLSIGAMLGAVGHCAPRRLPRPFALASAGVLHLAAQATGFVLFACGRYARRGPDA